MHRQNSVTPFQYFAIISGVLIANGVMSLPRAVAADAGRSAWLVVLVVGIIMSLVTLLADILASKFPLQDAADWPKTLLGPVLGRVWMAIYLLRAIIFTLLTAQLFAGIMSVRLLHNTPIYIFALIVLLLSLMAVLSRINGLARYAEIAFYLSMPLFLFILFPFSDGNTNYLLPLLGDKPASDLLKGAVAVSYSFAGFDFLWFVYPHLRNKASSRPVAVGAILFTTAVYTFVTATAIMFFGLESLGILYLPTLALLSGIELVLVERIDSLMLFIWLSTVVVTAASQLYTASRLLQGLVTSLSFGKNAVFLSGMLLVLAVNRIPLRDAVAFSDLFGIADLLFLLVSILLFLLLALLRKGGVSDES